MYQDYDSDDGRGAYVDLVYTPHIALIRNERPPRRSASLLLNRLTTLLLQA